MMLGLDRQGLVVAAMLLITAAFISSRWIKPPFAAWWRRGVVVGYLLAVGVALVWVATWLLRL